MNRYKSIQELQKLSEYLDGGLSEKDRIQVEANLQAEPELRDELEGLKRTRLLLSQLPKKRVPHNFFITPEMVQKRQPLRLFPIFRLASALAGLFLVVVFAGNLLFGPGIASQSAAPNFLALQAQSANSAVPGSANAPMIVWGTPENGSPNLSSQANGLGGGPGSAAANGLGSSSSDTTVPSVVAGLALSTPPELQVTTPTPELGGGTPLSTGSSSEAATPPSEAATPPAVKSLNPQPDISTPPEVVGGTPDAFQSGPVLGVNPTQGAIDAQALNQEQTAHPAISQSTFTLAEGGLAVLGILAGLAALFFYRRERS